MANAFSLYDEEEEAQKSSTSTQSAPSTGTQTPSVSQPKPAAQPQTFSQLQQQGYSRPAPPPTYNPSTGVTQPMLSSMGYPQPTSAPAPTSTPSPAPQPTSAPAPQQPQSTYTQYSYPQGVNGPQVVTQAAPQTDPHLVKLGITYALDSKDAIDRAFAQVANSPTATQALRFRLTPQQWFMYNGSGIPGGLPPEINSVPAELATLRGEDLRTGLMDYYNQRQADPSLANPWSLTASNADQNYLSGLTPGKQYPNDPNSPFGFYGQQTAGPMVGAPAPAPQPAPAMNPRDQAYYDAARAGNGGFDYNQYPLWTMNQAPAASWLTQHGWDANQAQALQDPTNWQRLWGDTFGTGNSGGAGQIDWSFANTLRGGQPTGAPAPNTNVGHLDPFNRPQLDFPGDVGLNPGELGDIGGWQPQTLGGGSTGGGTGTGGAGQPNIPPPPPANQGSGQSDIERILLERVFGQNAGQPGYGVEQLQQWLQNPSAFDDNVGMQLFNRLKQGVDEDFDLKRQYLAEEMARRGIDSSSIHGGRLGDLTIQHDRTLGNMGTDIAIERARTFGQDRASSLGLGLGYSGLGQQGIQNAIAQLLGYGQQQFDNQMDVDRYNSDLDFRNLMAWIQILGGLS